MKKELTPRKKQALEMRSRIQNVALELFDKEGFELSLIHISEPTRP